MHLFYLAIGINSKHQVIVSSQTHVATAHAIELTGARAVFVDSDDTTGNINIDQIEKKINKHTKAIAVVHYLGIPVDMHRIVKIAKKYNLYILEDCALSLGSKFKNKHVGLFGDAGAFSFYPAKHMTTAEGGMLILKNKKLYEKVKIIRGIGVNKSFDQRKFPGMYDVPVLGLNYRMSEINCAIGIEQIKKLKKFISVRIKNYKFYEKKIKKINNLKTINISAFDKKISPYCFPIIFNKIKLNIRNKILILLKNKKIGTSVYYPHPVPRLTYYKKKYGYSKIQFKNAEVYSDKMIVFPVGPHITFKNIDYIINSLLKILRNLKIYK
jgi:dTDP-4-amino-4,6-dideoxygalactose transaminase